jgi:hypothetical protein
MNVSDINGMRVPVQGYPGSNAGGYDYAAYQPRQEDQRVAGVQYRPKTGQRSINEVFTRAEAAPQRIENRSLVTNDIQGASAKRHYI